MFICTKYALVHTVKKGHLATWPKLTVEVIKKYLKLTTSTDTGHMIQKRQNIRSTKKKMLEAENEYITPLGSGEKTHIVFAVVLDQGQIYTALTGSFPSRSSKGYNGLMICYSYDANYLRPIAMKWVRAFGVVLDEMTAKGFKPKLQPVRLQKH
jgi:hypothetical protein